MMQFNMVVEQAAMDEVVGRQCQPLLMEGSE
jgi:hypothetical protein